MAAVGGGSSSTGLRALRIFYEELFPKFWVKKHTGFESETFVLKDIELSDEELRVGSALCEIVDDFKLDMIRNPKDLIQCIFLLDMLIRSCFWP